MVGDARFQINKPGPLQPITTFDRSTGWASFRSLRAFTCQSEHTQRPSGRKANFLAKGPDACRSAVTDHAGFENTLASPGNDQALPSRANPTVEHVRVALSIEGRISQDADAAALNVAAFPKCLAILC